MSAALIQKLGQFTDLTDEDRELVARATQGRTRMLRGREVLIHEGQVPGGIYLIQQGWACRYNMLANGRRQITGILLPGDFCDVSVLLSRRMDHSVASISPLTVSEISEESLSALSNSSRAVERVIRWDVLVNASIQRQWLLNLGSRNAFARMAHLFCELFARLRNVELAGDAGYELPLRQHEIAEALGLTAVHVSRTLRDMRNDGLITFEAHHLRVLDHDRLRQAASFSEDYLHMGTITREPAGRNVKAELAK